MSRSTALYLQARDLHELLRVWENYRLIAAECHMRHIKFREETRYPGYYYHTDSPEVDDKDWKVFVNSTRDRDTGDWSFRKVPYEQLIKD